MDGLTPIVFDGGSHTCKAGFSGEDSPRVVIPTVIGRSLDKNVTDELGRTKVYVGNEAQQRRQSLAITGPIEHGIIANWDDMEKLWSHTFDILHAAPMEHPILLTDAPLNPKADRQKMAEVMFEKFGFPALNVADQASLCFYEDSDRGAIGISVDIGDSVTHITPVYEGFYIPHATVRLKYGGKGVTDHLLKSCEEHERRGSTRDAVTRVKEVACYVAFDYEQELLESSQKVDQGGSYALPDGKIITLDHERFSAPEVLFQPDVLGLQLPGIDKAIVQVLERCDVDMRAQLCKQIVLSGGTTMLPGLADRLTKELATLLPSFKIEIVARPERQYCTWIGGSILTSLSTFDKMWVSKQDYEDFGPSIINRRCL